MFVKDWKDCGQEVSGRCGGHVHIGANHLTTVESWESLIEIWGNTEEILYIIGNKEGEVPREDFIRHATPISKGFERILNSDLIDIKSVEDAQKFVQASQTTRTYGINFQNLGEGINTIEFRLANGTIDSKTWIENVNLFGGIIKASEKLGLIQNKKDEEITLEDKQLLEKLQLLKKEGVSQEEKLGALLDLVVPENKREIYRRRYQVNNELLDKSAEVKEKLEKNIAKKPISVNKIVRKVFCGEDRIKGDEYNENARIIEHNLENGRAI